MGTDVHDGGRTGPALRVLVVEDSTPDAELVTALLEESAIGLEVQVCTTLRDAIEQLSVLRFDVALADLSLPDAQGLEAVRALREAAHELPLVVLTGHDDERTALAALAAGAQDYVSKNDLSSRLLTRCLGYAQERVRADRALRSYARWTAALLDGLESPTCAVDASGRVVLNNAAMRDGGEALLLRCGLGQDVTQEWDMASSRVATTLLAGLREVLSGSLPRFEIECEGPDGRWWSVRTTPLPGRAGAVISQVDVTDLKRAQRQLSAAALHDALTGLPNRALMRDRLNQAFGAARREGRVVAVTFFDLDRFKVVNDTLGHAAGDEVLVAVAERLTDAVRGVDTVARVSGDEFVVVVVADDQLEAHGMAARTMEAVNGVVEVAGAAVSVTASAGIAVALPGDAVDDVLQAADEAMYVAKARGGGCLAEASGEVRSMLARRLAVESALERALAAGRIEVHYQPVVRLRDGALRGVEALVRLRDDDGRLLPPAEFIDVAERSGLIVPLGRAVLQTACEEAAGWRGAASGLSVAVNLSTRQLAQPDVVDTVAACLRTSGLEAARLVLEVTESAVVQDAEAAMRALSALKDLGVRTAIDDFGTGYSSFLYLKQFPVDYLKIDRSFVAGMLDNPDDAAIVSSIVRLGRDIGVTLIAEGIETEAQHRHLLGLGCDEAQGYLFARPAPAHELEDAFALALRAVPVDGRTEARPTSGPAGDAYDRAVLERIGSLAAAGSSLHTIAALLNSEGSTSPTGRRWHPRAVARVLDAVSA